MSKFAIGTAQFGMPYGCMNQSGQVSLDEVSKILALGKQHGLNMLDTAVTYGNAHQCLGEVGINNWNVVSKIPSFSKQDFIKEKVSSYVKSSLDDLKLGSLYGLLLHDANQLLSRRGEEIYKALSESKTEGDANKIGISIYDFSVLETLLEYYDFDLIQVPFNVFDNRLLECSWLNSSNKKFEVHVRSIFLQGILLSSPNSFPKKFAKWRHLFSRWWEWLSDNHLSPLQGCIRYVYNQPYVDKIVVGVDSLSQMIEIIECNKEIPLPTFNDISTNDLQLINPSLWIQ